MSKTTYEAKAPVIDDFCDPEPQEEMFSGFPWFLFTSEDLKKAKSREKLPCRCTRCGKPFLFRSMRFREKSSMANLSASVQEAVRFPGSTQAAKLQKKESPMSAKTAAGPCLLKNTMDQEDFAVNSAATAMLEEPFTQRKCVPK